MEVINYKALTLYFSHFIINARVSRVLLSCKTLKTGKVKIKNNRLLFEDKKKKK